MPFIVTQEHQAIFSEVGNSRGGNVIIDAVAGSGKTSTLMECLKLVRGSVLVLAFNRTVKAELADRVKRAHLKNVQVMTSNGLGHRTLAGLWRRNPDVNRFKVHALAEKLKIDDFSDDLADLASKAKTLGWWPAPDAVRALYALSDGASQARPHLDLADNLVPFQAWTELANRHGLLVNLGNEGVINSINKVQTVLAASAEDTQVIDYDDQILMPIRMNAPMSPYDWVFVDEAQDQSPLNRELIAKSLGVGGRLVAVGDEHQSIYAFRGADFESMRSIRERFNCRSFPLHVSYRCPQAVARYVSERLVPHFSILPGADEGHFSEVSIPVEHAEVAPGDLVICRNNAPLVVVALKLLAKNVPVIVRNAGEGKKLTSRINRLAGGAKARLKFEGNADSISSGDFVDYLEYWYHRQLQNETDARVIALLKELSATMHSFAAVSSTVKEMKIRVERMFCDVDSVSKDEVLACTIHTAKGLEANRVWLVDRPLIPSALAKEEWQVKQEDNLLYVAVTRARSHLQCVASGNLDAKKKVPMPKVHASKAGAADERGPEVMVKGKTFEQRAGLKALRGRWDEGKRAWFVPADKAEIVSAMGLDVYPAE